MIKRISLYTLCLSYLIIFVCAIVSLEAPIVRYFANGGVDTGGCTDYNNPCATYTYAEGFMDGVGGDTADKLLFKCDDTWTLTSQFDVNVSDTIISSWYGAGVEGVSGNRPVFTGGQRPDSGTEGFPTCSPVASCSSTQSLIHIGNATYTATDVTLKNLEVKYSYRGHGINNHGNSTGLLLINMYVHDHERTALYLRGSGVGVQNSEISDAPWCFKDSPQRCTTGHPGMISLHETTGAVFNSDYLHDGYTEIIVLGPYSELKYSTIESGTVGAYVNGDNDTLIHHNKFLCTDGATYCGSAIFYNVETGAQFHSITSGDAWANAVVNWAKGLRISCQNTGELVDGVTFAQNTAINNDVNFELDSAARLGTIDPVAYKNNISYLSIDGLLHVAVSGTPGGLTKTTNLFFQEAGVTDDEPNSGEDFYDVSQVEGDPDFNSAFGAITDRTDFDIYDCLTQATGAGVDTGTVLVALFDDAFLSGTDLNTDPVNPTISLGDRDTIGTSNWNIGIGESGSIATPVSAKPQGIIFQGVCPNC